MAQDAIETARQIYTDFGLATCTNAQGFRAVFRDVARNRWEKNLALLALAVEEGIPAYLASEDNGPPEERIRKAQLKLSGAPGIEEHKLLWAVQVWSHALGLTQDRPDDLDEYAASDVIFNPPPPPPSPGFSHQAPAQGFSPPPPPPSPAGPAVSGSQGIAAPAPGMIGGHSTPGSRQRQAPAPTLKPPTVTPPPPSKQPRSGSGGKGLWIALGVACVIAVVLWSLPKDGGRKAPEPVSAVQQTDAKAKAEAEQRAAAKAKADAEQQAAAKARAEAAARPAPAALPDPQKPDVAPDAATQRKVQAFLEKYLSAFNRGTPEEVSRYYDSSVVLFDKGAQERRFVLEDLQRYFKRWPTRRSNLLGRVEVFDTKTPDVKKAVFSIRYYRERSGEPNCASGSARYTCLVRVEGSTCYIREINEDIDRDPKGVCVKI